MALNMRSIARKRIVRVSKAENGLPALGFQSFPFSLTFLLFTQPREIAVSQSVKKNRPARGSGQ